MSRHLSLRRFSLAVVVAFAPGAGCASANLDVAREQDLAAGRTVRAVIVIRHDGAALAFDSLRLVNDTLLGFRADRQIAIAQADVRRVAPRGGSGRYAQSIAAVLVLLYAIAALIASGGTIGG